MVKPVPKMSALVVTAIRNLREVHGSTSREILNYITSEYDTSEPTVQRQMYTALKRGLAYGILKRIHGHYCLNTESDPNAAPQDNVTPMEACKRRRRKKKRCRKKTTRCARGCVRKRRRKRRSCKRRRRRRSCKRKRRRRCCNDDPDMYALDPLENTRVRYDRDLERSRSRVTRNSRSRSHSSGDSARDQSGSRREKLAVR